MLGQTLFFPSLLMRLSFTITTWLFTVKLVEIKVCGLRIHATTLGLQCMTSSFQDPESNFVFHFDGSHLIVF